MPRDSSGNYTLPVGNPVIDGTVIDVDWANPTMSDIAVQLNNVLTRDGLLGPILPFYLVDGSAAIPGLGFNSSNNTGLYRLGGGGGIGFTVGGTESLLVQPTGVTSPLVFTASGPFAANGGVTLGDAAADSLVINSNVASLPNGLSFSGNVSVTGNTTLGDAASDVFTVNSNTVTAPNGLNFPGSTTFSGTVNFSGVTSFPGTTTFVGPIFANGGATLGDAAADPLTINSNIISATNNLTINGTARSLALGATDLTWDGVGRAVIHASGGGGAANSGGAFFANNGGATIAAIGEYATMYGGAVTNTAAIYAVNDLDIGAGAAPTRMRVTSVGNVGVGANPLVKFQVRGATDNNIGIYSGGGSSVIHSFTDAGANTVPLLVGGNPLRLSGNGGAAVHATLDNSGNLGIGAISPSSSTRLYLAGPAPSGGGLNLEIRDTAAGQSVQLTRTGSAFAYAGVGPNQAWLFNPGSSDLNLGPDGAGNVAIVTSGARRVVVSAVLAEFKLPRLSVRGDPSFGTAVLTGDAAGRSGYVSFIGSNDVRAGYIGYAVNVGTADTGDISYVCGLHQFTGLAWFISGYKTNRTWQSLGRAFNTDFVAPAYDIELKVSGTMNSGSMSLLINGAAIQNISSGVATFNGTVTATVPAGATYRVNVVSTALSVWAELR